MVSADLIETTPFPGFPTDLQAQFSALACTTSGTTLVVENLFETRYKYAGELKRMGADITVRGRNAVTAAWKGCTARALPPGILRGGRGARHRGFESGGGKLRRRSVAR